MGRDSIVIQAIRNVLGRESLTDWARTPGCSIADLIYEEVRRLDRAALGQQTGARESSQDRSVTADALMEEAAPALHGSD